MGGAIDGGGFFYSPLNQCTIVTPITVQPGVGVNGAWGHGPAGWLVQHRIRYVQVDISFESGNDGVYSFQLGYGTPGAEQVWLPTDENSLTVSWVGPNYWKTPYSFYFPASLQKGADLCARAYVFVGVPLPTIVSVICCG
jgi:hypothetical protein